MNAAFVVIAALVLQQDTSMQRMHMPMQHDTTMKMPMQRDTTLNLPMQQGMHAESQMLMTRVGDFSVMAMAQAFPTFTFFLPRTSNTALSETGGYVTQPAVMANVANHDQSVVLRATLNFESWTQRHGELTPGAWGEGFIDKRHPHTLLHEFNVSFNRGTASKGWSLTVGKGFAPYGTDDPMSRPALKYPTNHHLSQVLERWIASGVFGYRTWGLEAGLFSGDEPQGPNDLGNYHHFGNSWSARVMKRLGTSEMAHWPLEVSASFAHVVEVHNARTVRNQLMNAAIRHEANHGDARVYAMLEASRGHSEQNGTLYSILGEGALRFGPNQPYARVEWSTRPEYVREGAPTEAGFYHYDHDANAIGATRWLILTGGYGRTVVNRRFSLRPYAETEYNRIKRVRGLVDPVALYGRSSFWSISAGVRIFLGGDPMRMGTYGVLDPMRAMHEMPAMPDMNLHEH